MTVVEPTAIAARRDQTPPPRPKKDTRRMVACAICGMHFDCSARAFRYYRAGQRTPRCMLHRQENPRPETVAIETRMEILGRYTDAEVFLMGWALELTVTGRALPIPPEIAADVQGVASEWLSLAASADA